MDFSEEKFESTETRSGDDLPPEQFHRRFVYPFVGAVLASALFATGAIASWLCFGLCFAAFSALGFVVGREEDRLAAMCTVDALTGLHSRAYFLERVNHELKCAEQRGTALAVLMIDVDQLRAINQHYGSQSGDRVLLAVAAAIRAQLRGSDAAARWGEDEFAVILPNSTAEGANRFAERVRQRVAEYHHALTVRINTTTGVADLTPDTDILSEGLLIAATRDLKRAKIAKTPPPIPSSMEPSFF